MLGFKHSLFVALSAAIGFSFAFAKGNKPMAKRSSPPRKMQSEWKSKLNPNRKPKRCRGINDVSLLFRDDDDHYGDDDYWDICRDWEMIFGDYMPTSSPSSLSPSMNPTELASTTLPTAIPTTSNPSYSPTDLPSEVPTSVNPTSSPTSSPSSRPPTPFPTSSTLPSSFPSFRPTISEIPSSNPTSNPTKVPTAAPINPSNHPTTNPTSSPTVIPSEKPSSSPTISRSGFPSNFPTQNPSVEPTKSPVFETDIPSNDPSTSPVFETDIPSNDPSKSPILETNIPSSERTKSPSPVSPTNVSSNVPTKMTNLSSDTPTVDSVIYTSIPSNDPTMVSVLSTNLPTIVTGTISSRIPTNDPTPSEKTSVPIAFFSLDLAFATARRSEERSKQVENHTRDLNINNFDESQLYDSLRFLLNNYYELEFSPLYYSIDLNMFQTDAIRENDFTVISHVFNGNVFFSTDNTLLLPTEDELVEPTLDAFTGNDFIDLLQAAEDPLLASVESVTVTKLSGPNSETTETPNQNVEVNAGNEKVSRSWTITVVASAVASVSTVTALLLLFARRRIWFGQDVPTNPLKRLSPRNIRALSPFTVSPKSSSPGGHFFQEIEDDGSYSIEPSLTSDEMGGKYAKSNNFSICDESSIGARSIAGFNSLNERSLYRYDGSEYDGESVSNMSALDEVRLGSVLQLEEGLADENSLAEGYEVGGSHMKKTSFAQVWNNHRRKQRQAASMNTNSPENLSSKIASSTQQTVAPGNNVAPSSKYNPKTIPETTSSIEEDINDSPSYLPSIANQVQTPSFTLELLKGVSRDKAPEDSSQSDMDDIGSDYYGESSSVLSKHSLVSESERSYDANEEEHPNIDYDQASNYSMGTADNCGDSGSGGLLDYSDSESISIDELIGIGKNQHSTHIKSVESISE